ncbi:MAG TPA: Asp-tRNA(Asn)/Glu-tRNA(Gln) amidotransferase subunit GatC [bacterium]|jgi:aspartyl-tRNA(Asn)/glutamyl-tRNA(Gln) amidotransferase subunit C|nr:Asp-tRNA(Asn)/Glu-tRNA(Gln) amidotransferase subunit GatC [bacterium]HPO11034.1 Asp-tRNA(Asn)/Glu-tRNA(Gln) amidotransferase subunit GatC [bacterium]
MFVDKEKIKYIAKLSKIKLSNKELDQISKQVEQILEYVDQLNEINDDIEPLENISGNYNRLRDDVIIDFNNKEQILKNAPKTKDGFILVPKVLDN